MRLYQHPDFRDAIVAASNHFAPKGISTQLIEKDYYVTEALRTIAGRWDCYRIRVSAIRCSRNHGNQSVNNTTSLVSRHETFKGLNFSVYEGASPSHQTQM